MTPTILYFLLRYYRRHHPEKAEKIQQLFSKVSRIIMFFLLSTLLPLLLFSQEKKMEYNIKKNGDIVGKVQFTQSTSDNRTIMKLESEVKTRFIFTFTAKGNEEAVYDNGILTYSSIYRKLNGNVKADKKTKMSGDSYTIYKGSKTEIFNNYPIRYNMLSIYIMEPVNIAKVYSDNFQEFLEIQKINTQHYKIKFPDGNYSEYYYDAGVCSRIEVHHSLYSATVELKK